MAPSAIDMLGEVPFASSCITMATRLLLLVTLLFCAGNAQAQTGTCTPALGEAMLDVGNVRARILNNGSLFWRGSPIVYEVPKGSGINALFNGSL